MTKTQIEVITSVERRRRWSHAGRRRWSLVRLRRRWRARPGSMRANCLAGGFLLSAQFILKPLSPTTFPHLAVSALTKSLNSCEVLLMA